MKKVYSSKPSKNGERVDILNPKDIDVNNLGLTGEPLKELQWLITSAPSVNPKRNILIAYNKENKITGFAAIRADVKLKSDVGNPLFLKQIKVLPEYRNQGYATKILNEVKNFAAKENFSSVTLVSCSGNLSALNLYIKERFKIYEINAIDDKSETYTFLMRYIINKKIQQLSNVNMQMLDYINEKGENFLQQNEKELKNFLTTSLSKHKIKFITAEQYENFVMPILFSYKEDKNSLLKQFKVLKAKKTIKHLKNYPEEKIVLNKNNAPVSTTLSKHFEESGLEDETIDNVCSSIQTTDDELSQENYLKKIKR